jgi:hypothetical protein
MTINIINDALDDFYVILTDKKGIDLASLTMANGQVTDLVLLQNISPAKLRDFIYHAGKKYNLAKGVAEWQENDD